MKVIQLKKYTSGFFGSLFGLICMAGFGQTNGQAPSGKGKAARDSLPTPIYISAGVDLSRVLLDLIPHPFSGAEAMVDVRKGKLMYSANFGLARHETDLTTYKPKSSGFYVGAGISKCLISDESNALAFGLRISGASFNYQPLNVRIPRYAESGFDLVPLNASRNSAFWGEVNASVRTRLTGWVMMGFELRMKARLNQQISGFTPFFIPGYGLEKNAFSPGLNYYIFVQFPKGRISAGKTH